MVSIPTRTIAAAHAQFACDGASLVTMLSDANEKCQLKLRCVGRSARPPQGAALVVLRLVRVPILQFSGKEKKYNVEVYSLQGLNVGNC